MRRAAVGKTCVCLQPTIQVLPALQNGHADHGKNQTGAIMSRQDVVKPRITPERSRAIFKNPLPPVTVTERQFDGFDDELARLARTPWQDMQQPDLWYYLHDMTYVTPLQPALLRYLFPVCLTFWYDALMQNHGAAIGDADFHLALHRGDILERYLTPTEREAVYTFFVDGFMDRLEQERGFLYDGQRTRAYGWMMRFNSIGYVAPIIDRIWEGWWALDHPGKAVCALMYASGLVYLPGENPIFKPWNPTDGGGGPYMDENDSMMFDASWLDANLAFLQQTLTFAWLTQKLDRAAALLKGEPEAARARQIADDALTCQEVITIRIEDMLTSLSSPWYTSQWE
jgi:hypothetical protein